MTTLLAARNPLIDVLRGVAILLVMLLHFALSYGLSDIAPWLVPPDWVRRVVINGNYGVTTFFVISGYLIASNVLVRPGGINRMQATRFYRDRAARILPGLILALTLIVLLGLAGMPSFGNGDCPTPLPLTFFAPAVLSVLSFWHNVLMQQVGYFNYAMNIYWSLSVEELFYLLFPLACLLLRRRAAIAALCCACVASGPIYRAMHAGDELYFMYGYAACFDAIAMGIIVALFPLRVGARTRWAIGVVATAVWCTMYLRGIDGNEVFGFSGLALATAAILVAVREAQAGPRCARGLAWLGQHSYELYLFHIIVLGCMRDAVPREALPPALRLVWLVVFLVGSALLAATIARRITEPARRRWRAREWCVA